MWGPGSHAWQGGPVRQGWLAHSGDKAGSFGAAELVEEIGLGIYWGQAAPEGASEL